MNQKLIKQLEARQISVHNTLDLKGEDKLVDIFEAVKNLRQDGKTYSYLMPCGDCTQYAASNSKDTSLIWTTFDIDDSMPLVNIEEFFKEEQILNQRRLQELREGKICIAYMENTSGYRLKKLREICSIAFPKDTSIPSGRSKYYLAYDANMDKWDGSNLSNNMMPVDLEEFYKPEPEVQDYIAAVKNGTAVVDIKGIRVSEVNRVMRILFPQDDGKLNLPMHYAARSSHHNNIWACPQDSGGRTIINFHDLANQVSTLITHVLNQPKMAQVSDTEYKPTMLTRTQLLLAHKQFSCEMWRESIVKILTDNPLAKESDKITIPAPILHLLKNRGDVAQKKYAKSLGVNTESKVALVYKSGTTFKDAENDHDILAINASDTSFFNLNMRYDWKIEGNRLIPTFKD